MMMMTGYEKFRLVAGVVVLLCGLWLALGQLTQHHWLSALAYALAGILSGLLLALGIVEDYSHPVFVFGFGLVAVLGVPAIFFEHRAFEAGRTEVLAEGVGIFVRLEAAHCALPPARVHYLQQEGTRACAMQGIFDQVDAVQAFQRAQAVPPELTVPDGLLQLTQEPPSDPCIAYLREVDRACPHVLTSDVSRKLAALRR